MSVIMSVSNGIETFIFKSVLSHGDTGKSITAIVSPETALTVAESTSAAAADTKDYDPLGSPTPSPQSPTTPPGPSMLGPPPPTPQTTRTTILQPLPGRSFTSLIGLMIPRLHPWTKRKQVLHPLRPSLVPGLHQLSPHTTTPTLLPPYHLILPVLALPQTSQPHRPPKRKFAFESQGLNLYLCDTSTEIHSDMLRY